SSPTPGTMGKNRIIKAISSVVKPPTGGFFVFVVCQWQQNGSSVAASLFCYRFILLLRGYRMG
ncbi:hypothetical protein, partial [Citrobacter freundii]|uniref:hypothetical protein n=1 Tax=Citrobacter freundii TaxID=546 RepID=UPI00397AC041